MERQAIGRKRFPVRRLRIPRDKELLVRVNNS
jgi:hypothetical protein